MKILLIHPHDIFSNKEPWTARIRNISYGLANKGHDVRVCHFPISKTKDKLEVPFRFIRLRRSKLFFPFNLFRLIRHVLWADVVHLQKAIPHATIPALMLTRLFKKPLHYDWDDLESEIIKKESKKLMKAKVIKYFEKKMPNWSESISVASPYLRARAIKYGVDKKRLHSARVGVDADLFKPLESDVVKVMPTVVYVGQLNQTQVVDELIQVAKLVLNYQKVLFKIVGTGSALPSLQEKVKKEGVEDYFIFRGAVSHDEVPRLLSQCDVAVALFGEEKLYRAKSHVT